MKTLLLCLILGSSVHADINRCQLLGNATIQSLIRRHLLLCDKKTPEQAAADCAQQLFNDCFLLAGGYCKDNYSVECQQIKEKIGAYKSAKLGTSQPALEPNNDRPTAR